MRLLAVAHVEEGMIIARLEPDITTDFIIFSS